MSLFFVAIEVEDAIREGHFLNYHAWGEIVVFGFLFPFAGGYIVSALLKIENERAVTKRLLLLEHNLIEQMNHAQDWHELTAELTHFFSQVAPFAGLTLFVYDRLQLFFKPSNEWRHPQHTIPPVTTSLAQQHLGQFTQLYKLHPQTVANLLPELTTYQVYCLPLVHGYTPMAVVYLYLPMTQQLNTHQIVALNNIGPLMASAIAVFHPDGFGLLRGAAAETEKRRLARHLHDTLAQNLSYLCLQLDILRSTNQLDQASRPELLQKLTALHAAANESYEQVRMTLTTLQPAGPNDLETSLIKQVNKMIERANLTVKSGSRGSNVPLPPHIKRQTEAIFREALTNIEKHAQATTVSLNFEWQTHELKITLQDDGEGFAPEQLNNGHYGLSIMQERAQEMGATFSLHSVPHKGTTLSLQIPLSQPLLGAEK